MVISTYIVAYWEKPILMKIKLFIVIQYGLVSFALFILLGNNLLAQKKSSEYTLEYQRLAFDLFEKSISFQTVDNSGTLPDYSNYLAEAFRNGGFPDEDVIVLPMTASDGENLSALVVRYRGDGSSGKKPILLLAHMDVVAAKREDWDMDPFQLNEKDGYFFGRGTMDVKMGIVMLSTTFIRLKQEGFVPTRDLIIAFTGDEETGGFTTTYGLTTTYRDLLDAEYALNTEPGGGELSSNYEPVNYFVGLAEKTYATFELTIRNPGGHSSIPRQDNAIYELVDAVKRIEDYQFPIQYDEGTLKYFALNGGARSDELGKAMVKFSMNPSEETAKPLRADAFENGKLCTTCVATMLRAGHAENALPQSATATVNCRIFPGVDVSEVQGVLTEIVQNGEMEITVLDDPFSSPPSPINDEVFEAVAKAVHSRYPGISIIPYMSNGATDAVYFRAAGIPTYGVSGLFSRKEDAFAHGLNERVGVSNFFDGLEHWYLLLMDLAGSD